MKKKILSMMLTVCMIVVALAGCGRAKTETTPNAETAPNTETNSKTEQVPEKMTFTYVTAPLNVPSIVEREKGIFTNAFEDMGIKVEYAELESGADQTQALASGDVQVLYGVGATSVILSAANGADIKVLSMYSRSPEAFCLYSKDTAIKSPKDLKGKTIAGPAGTNLHELLVSYLKEGGMTIDDVNYVNMSISEAKTALDSGNADVALLAGVTAYQAEQQRYHLITDGEDLIDAIIAVAVTDEFYNKYPDVIKKLMQTQVQIEDYIDEHEDEAIRITAKALDLDEAAVDEMHDDYDFSPEIEPEDKRGFQTTADFLFESGMIDEKLDVNTLFYK